MTTFWPGQIVGKYRIERLLHEGTLSLVVEATHLLVGQRVALKILHPDRLAELAAVERFHHEALLVSSLQSHHAVRVMDFDLLEQGEPYQMMEYLGGPTLAQVVRTRGPRPVEQAVRWILDAGEAISELHARGAVHRNLSLQNLMLDRAEPDAVLKVIGFSVARHPDLSLDETDAVLGTPVTMSPEQLRTPHQVDARTDVWALGVALYELLTGVPPFLGETLAEVALSIVSSTPVPLDERRAGLPAGLASVVLRALQKPPAERPASVEVWTSALRPFASWASVH